jgi:flagellar motor switch protein FliN/FliY
LRLDPNLPRAAGPGHWFAQAWALALGEIAEALDLGGGAGPLEVRAGAADPADWTQWSEPIWHVQSWTPGDGARLWLGCSSDVPRALWRHIGGSDDPDASSEALDTFREMLNHAASAAASEAMARLERTVQASAAAVSSEPEAGWAVELHFEAGGQSATIALAGNAAMAEALNPAEVAEAPPAASPGKSAASGHKYPHDPFDLIREVDLELAVSFGETLMPLAEVLKLASGAIIELNRSVTDPVEVLVNDSVIARGDVVVVDGNYGVRITEIVSRRDRVRSML